jgi:transcriptional regulator with XRE-family HTH domain
MLFSSWLSWHCTRAELSQADLCRAVNAHPGAASVSRQATHRWFSGSATPSVTSLAAVCDVLELSSDQRAEAIRLIAQGAA